MLHQGKTYSHASAGLLVRAKSRQHERLFPSRESTPARSLIQGFGHLVELQYVSATPCNSIVQHAACVTLLTRHFYLLACVMLCCAPIWSQCELSSCNPASCCRAPRLLICDEATSALDTATEQGIMGSLDVSSHAGFECCAFGSNSVATIKRQLIVQMHLAGHSNCFHSACVLVLHPLLCLSRLETPECSAGIMMLCMSAN